MSPSIKADLDDKTAMAGNEKIEQLAELDEDTRRMEKRLVRKLDMTLMPVVWVLYFFNCKSVILQV